MNGEFGDERYGDDDSVGRRVTRVLFGGFLLTALVVGLYLSLSGAPGGAGGDSAAQGQATEADGGRDRGGGGGRANDGDGNEEKQAGGGPSAEELIDAAPAPEETTIQLLDGATPEATAAAGEVLTELGYDVVAVNPGRDYEQTTVFFNPGQRKAARALRARDERFGVVAPNDRGLSDAVDLHIVVGADWGE